jgi:hypothetical protein
MCLVDDVGRLVFTFDALLRADTRAGPAPGTQVWVDPILDERLAHTSRAAPLMDVGLVFVTEVLERGQHRIRRRLA